MERFKARCLKAGIKPATVNRDLSRIRGALSRAVDWSLLAEHPMRTVKPAKGADDSRVRYLSPDEEKALRQALSRRDESRRQERDSGNRWLAERGHAVRPAWLAGSFTDYLAPMVLLALNTGMRRGELLGLEWASVNLQAKLLTITAANAKSRRARHLPLNAEALDTPRAGSGRGTGLGLVFPSPAGYRMGNINSSWEALCAAGGVGRFPLPRPAA